MYSSASSLIKSSLLRIRVFTDSALHGFGLHSSGTDPTPKVTQQDQSNLILKEGGEEPAKEDDGERLNVDLKKKEVRRTNYPVRPEAEDCPYFMKTGVCKFGFNCKFNHPIRRKNQAAKEKDESTEKTRQQNCKVVKEKDESTEKSRQQNCKAVKEKVKEKHESTEKTSRQNCKVVKEKDESTEKMSQQNCKVVKEKVKEKDESTEKTSQQNCKYYLRTGGCKYGKACRYNHSKQNSTVDTILEHNFMGLPIRKGEKECPYYMRNGSCKYGDNCRFNHPDPELSEAFEPPSGYDNGGSVSSQAASQVNMASWSSPTTLNDSAAYMPNIFPPTQGVPPPNPEYNEYQESRLHPKPAFVMGNPSAETTSYTHHQSQVAVDEFPEWPGQPECSYFLKNGDCKFKSNRKYHHPKNRDAKLAPCALSDKGLPLRPDQRICSRYSRYGVCKLGPACKFDHSLRATPSAVSELDQPPSFSHSSTAEQAGIA